MSGERRTLLAPRCEDSIDRIEPSGGGLRRVHRQQRHLRVQRPVVRNGAAGLQHRHPRQQDQYNQHGLADLAQLRLPEVAQMLQVDHRKVGEEGK